jgi:hypothetical protein
MKAADLGNRDDAAPGWRLDVSEDGGVPVEREVGPTIVVAT